MTGPAVVGLGGGHGLAVTLTALRRYAGDITAVVSVADDGGSSGRIRKDFGLPAPGDIRRCLVALAGEPGSAWARAFGHRFPGGDVEGHVLGNLVLAALVEATGSFIAAVEEAGRLLQTTGRVYPATEGAVVLTAESAVGRLVGQTAVEDHASALTTVEISPRDARSPAQVLEALQRADQIVLGPGSLFTSVLAVAAVSEIREILATRRTVFVCNLKPSKETLGFTASDHVEALRRHGVRPDVVLVDPEAIEVGDVDGPTTVATCLADTDGWAHDPELLARALRHLA